MPVKYVVVVMLENRSYDNVLGWLYDQSNAAPFNIAPFGQEWLNGLTGSESNPNPFETGQTIPVQNIGSTTNDGLPYPGTCIPVEDPGEYFEDIAQQINSLPQPATSNPYGTYDPNAAGLMQGFTSNYAGLDGFDQQTPPASAVPEIMNYFTPAQLPVTSFLAYNYAVCDSWFASVPAQTFTNRAFALTGAPGVSSDGFSLVDDAQWADSIASMPSLLSVLDSVPDTSGPQWKVYFHDYSIACMTVPYVQQQGLLENNVNVSTFDNSDWGSKIPHQLDRGLLHKSTLPPTFIDDAASGSLPPFSFIEPRYGTYNKPIGVTPPPNKLPANSNHPGPGYGDPSVYAPPIDVASGELFLLQVYNALVGNATTWPDTLLIVTYDEHGGLFDHVPPPLATQPGPSVPAAADTSDSAAKGFDFNVFGCRVPAIIVSPCIAPGTSVPPVFIIDDAAVVASPDSGSPPFVPFDHTSIIRTVWDTCNLDSVQPSLTDRDAAAPSLASFVLSEVLNTTGVYTEAVICGPSSLVFTAKGSQVAFAASGPTDTLSAALAEKCSWVTVSTTGTSYLTINVTVTDDSTSQTATINVTSANGATAGSVTVNLVV